VTTDFVDLLPAVAALTDPVQSVDLAQVAALVGLSASRVQRVFTDLMGESPKTFGRTTRLDFGAILLTTTDNRIIDIAFKSGFASHEGFTRAFRDQFGQSPTEWRSQRRNIRTPAEVRAVVATSRCLRLHHRPLQRKEPSMDYKIETEVLTPVPVLYQHRRVERDALGDVLAEMLPAVFGHVMEAGLAPAGHPFVRYLEVSPAYLTIDAGIPLIDAPETARSADSGIVTGELPGGFAAVTVHRGPYEDLGDAHAALDRWITESEHQPAGDLWEIYLTDPGEVPNPSDWLTKVCWPIR